jgi:RNA polymerase sigma-70 factor (ECF subfamily)
MTPTTAVHERMNETDEAVRLSTIDNLTIAGHIGTKQREFLALLMPVLPKLSRFCQAMCRGKHGPTGDRSSDAERAKDLVSETILKAYEHFDKIREPNAFLSYLFTIATRTNRHERKRSARWQPISEIEIEAFADERNAPDANADVAHLYAALAKLPKKQREAIVMSEITGLKLEEVAKIQSSSLSAVKSRVSRGRKKLAKLLGVNEVSVPTHSLDAIASGGMGNGQSFYHTKFAFEAKEKL